MIIPSYFDSITIYPLYPVSLRVLIADIAVGPPPTITNRFLVSTFSIPSYFLVGDDYQPILGIVTTIFPFLI